MKHKTQLKVFLFNFINTQFYYQFLCRTQKILSSVKKSRKYYKKAGNHDEHHKTAQLQSILLKKQPVQMLLCKTQFKLTQNSIIFFELVFLMLHMKKLASTKKQLIYATCEKNSVTQQLSTNLNLNQQISQRSYPT
eukprot:TRINITY_DN34864_c0_g1_i4.p3 TRINITY_DN34864_c0_g1~~TRINITY_DN34864_c0_g1_i4.p3  ORF type:complete len:136 (-),score=5.45 TRINITY_DN34864_c0_g1_i4:656-1063(-)